MLSHNVAKETKLPLMDGIQQRALYICRCQYLQAVFLIISVFDYWGYKFSGNLILGGNFRNYSEIFWKIADSFRSSWINGNMQMEPAQCKKPRYPLQ